jgi:hypothetical protein
MKARNLADYKKLPLAILLACGGVNSAVADLQTIGPVTQQTLPGGILPTVNVFLNVWDQAASTSYSVDLGVPLLTFEAEASSTSLTWDLDSTFKTFAATGDAMTYNVAAVNENGGVHNNTTADSLMLSYPTGLQSQTFSATIAYPKFNSDQSVVVGFINLLNSTGQETQTSSSAGYFNSVFWGIGESIGNQLSASTDGTNQLSAFFLNTPSLASIKTTTNMTEFSPTGYFSLNLTNDTLVWTSTAVTAVPVPGAVWLFLGGILTLLGGQKRKSAFKV